MTGVVVGVMAVLLVAAAGVTTASQSIFQVSPSRLRTLDEEGFGGATALAKLRAEPGRVRTGLRLLASMLALSAMGLAVGAGVIAWGVPGVTLPIVLDAALIFLVADVIPRGLAARNSVRLALFWAPIVYNASRWIGWLAIPVARLEGSDLVDGGNGAAEARELKELQEIGTEEGVLEEDENLLVERAFRLDEMTTWDVMTPRVEVFAWKESLTVRDVVSELPGVPYSRVPVYGESVDDITGVVYVREVYQAFSEGRPDVSLREIARDPFFVPGSLPLSKLLADFQNRRIHLGIVADEFGGIDGLVTLEDVLEELVGEIVDETDLEEEDFIRVAEDQLIVDAGIDLRDINHTFNVALPQLEHRSLNGFILEELGYVPREGESFDRDGVQIEILEATDTQVVRARLIRHPQDAAFKPEE